MFLHLSEFLLHHNKSKAFQTLNPDIAMEYSQLLVDHDVKHQKERLLFQDTLTNLLCLIQF